MLKSHGVREFRLTLNWKGSDDQCRMLISMPKAFGLQASHINFVNVEPMPELAAALSA